MKCIISFFLVVCFLSATPAYSQTIGPIPRSSLSDITGPELLYHISWLSSDSLEGRGTGTHANDVAAEYIAREFSRYGLLPSGDNGTFFQSFEVVTGVETGQKNALSYLVNGEAISFNINKDFIPASFSKSETAKGKLAFLGYGIKDTGLRNDYHDIPLKGCVALIFTGSPSTGSEGDDSRRLSSRQKVMTAREAGASAVLLVDPEDDELPKIHYDNSPSNAGIPVIYLTARAASKLLTSEGRDLTELNKLAQGRTGYVSFVGSSLSISLTTEVNFIRKNVRNIAGYLPGTSSDENYFVVGAHFDHLGWGQDGTLYRGSDPQVHHGADDNASGTAGVLELAQYFAAHKLKHSVLFIAFNGEEMGLLGSGNWVNHPTKPLDKISAMFNIDMIGRRVDSTKRLNVQGTGSSPEWDKIAKASNEKYHMDLALIPEGEGSSDHASFYMKNIPVLFFFTGLHTDYHRPSDSVEKINIQGEQEVVAYIAEVMKRTDALEGKLAFTKAKEDTTHARPRTGYNVYVGTIPDFGSSAEGFKISGTSPGSPAEKAGLKSGDIIMQLGETKILSIYDYMNALGLHKPDEEVPVKVKRGSDIITVTVHMARKK
jgi:aminopeptidase YwaD